MNNEHEKTRKSSASRSSATQSSTILPASGLMKLAVAGSALLAVAAGGLFYYASVIREKPADEKLIPIEVNARTCTPMKLTLPSGFHSFEIHNRSDRPVEWEILDGVMVVEERENIIPGMKAVLRAQLLPGNYEITCGLLSNPRGSLTVTPSGHSQAVAQARPDNRAFIAMLSEYKVFLVLQSNAMIRGAQALQAAIRDGNLQKAREAYWQARLPYKRIELTGGRFADLAEKIDPVAAYLEKRENDAAFTGFHRIEYGLWAQNSVNGLEPVADRLLADLTALQDRLKSRKLTPDMLLRNVSAFLDRQAEGQILSGENAYSHLDLLDFAAKLEGVHKILTLLQPLSEKPAPAETQAVMADAQSLHDAIATVSAGEATRPYTQIDENTRKMLAEKAKSLSAAVSKLAGKIGLE